MAKINRYDGNLLAFGSNSTDNYRTVFGDITQSNELDDNVNADYLTGWEIVGPTSAPSKQDFNALGFTHGQLLAYIHQMGVAEYNASQEYHSGSFCGYGGSLYVSLTDNNTGNTPSSSPSNWDPCAMASDLSDYYTSALLDAGQLDNRYYTETELDAGQLDNRYYTETELDAGQLDNRYYTETEVASFLSGKSDTGHGHDGADITSGTIDIARLPAGAIERLVIVADETARFALTVSEIQLGDTVKQVDTETMYFVVDEDNLDNSAGYSVYTAGTATSVAWSGITGKPTDFIQGSVGTTDNAIVRANGTGGLTSQGSLATIDDSGNVSANKFTSTVATGTAPLTVASTTVVTNLNADAVDGIQGSNIAKLDTANIFAQNINLATGKTLIIGTAGAEGTLGIFNDNANHYTKLIPFDGGSYAESSSLIFDADDGYWAIGTSAKNKIWHAGNLSTDGTFAANSDAIAPSQKAIKTYVDTAVGGVSAGLEGAMVTNTAGAFDPANSTETKVVWSTEDYDTIAAVDLGTNATRITIPAGVTYAKFSFGLIWESSAAGTRTARIMKNNATFSFGGYNFQDYNTQTSASRNQTLTTGFVPVTPGDYFEIAVTQNSGGNLYCSGYFTVETK